MTDGVEMPLEGEQISVGLWTAGVLPSGRVLLTLADAADAEREWKFVLPSGWAHEVAKALEETATEAEQA